MKHKTSTCKEYYLVQYAKLEAALISRKCYDTFHLVREYENITCNVVSQPAPTQEQVREWHETNISKQRDFGVDMGDWEGEDFTISHVETSSSPSFTSTLSSSLNRSVSSSSQSSSDNIPIKPCQVLIDVCPVRKAFFCIYKIIF